MTALLLVAVLLAVWLPLVWRVHRNTRRLDADSRSMAEFARRMGALAPNTGRKLCPMGLHPWRRVGSDRGGHRVYVCRVCRVYGA